MIFVFFKPYYYYFNITYYKEIRLIPACICMQIIIAYFSVLAKYEIFKGSIAAALSTLLCQRQN